MSEVWHIAPIAPIEPQELEHKRLSKIDLSLVWDDAKAMGIANRDLLSAIAGMFILMPSLISEQFIKMPAKLTGEPDNAAALARFAQYGADNWPVLLIHAVVTSFGALALYALLLRRERLTVSESLKAALPILPAYVLANMLQGMGVMSGLLLFLIPGFYLIGRLALIAPVAATEKLTNPLAILRRSAALTRGNGWRIFGVLAIIVVTMFIIGTVLASLVGAVSELVLPADIATLLMTLVSSLIEAAMAVIVVLISAALYRAAIAAR